MAVLLDEQQPVVVEQRDEGDRTGVHDGLAVPLRSVGEAQPRVIDGEERAFVDALVAQDLR